MQKKTKKKATLAEIEDLRMRLEEAEEALRAIQNREVDALVVKGPQGEEVFTLTGADQPYRIFIESMNEGAVTLDSRGNILYCNNRFCEMLKTSPNKILGSPLYQFIPSTEVSGFEAAFQTSQRKETKVDISLQTEDQRFLPVHLSLNGLPGQDIPVVHMVATDLTEQKRYEEEIVKSHAELLEAVEKLKIENIQRKQLEDSLRLSEKQVRFFASQCLTAQENERKRVAGELHDSIAAALGSLRFSIDKVVEDMKQGRGTLDSLQDLGSRVTDINNEVRRIMADLRPSVLDDFGILAALNWFSREYQKTYSNISVENQIAISEYEVPDTLKTPIFRISQEAMNNIARHSQASLVNFSLRKEDDKVLLTIQDNGRGFDLDTVRRGMGISHMRERAQLSGGSFDLESAIGKGTIIRVSWPVNILVGSELSEREN